MTIIYPEEVNSMRQAGVMLVVKDGLILGISRRNDKSKFGLLGGKSEEGESSLETAIRESQEEADITVTEATLIFHREEPRHSPSGEDFHSYCYYATNWFGLPQSCEEGEVRWLTSDELCRIKAAFGEFNTKTLQVFRELFPNVYLK